MTQRRKLSAERDWWRRASKHELSQVAPHRRLPRLGYGVRPYCITGRPWRVALGSSSRQAPNAFAEKPRSMCDSLSIDARTHPRLFEIPTQRVPNEGCVSRRIPHPNPTRVRTNRPLYPHLLAACSPLTHRLLVEAFGMYSSLDPPAQTKIEGRWEGRGRASACPMVMHCAERCYSKNSSGLPSSIARGGAETRCWSFAEGERLLDLRTCASASR